MIFISYSRADYLDKNNNIIIDSPVDVIVKALDEHNVEYWIDVEGDSNTQEYMGEIASAIEQSDYVLFISSKASNSEDSFWPIKEVTFAIELKKTILPINIDDSKYNGHISLGLSGLEIFEYYKNPAQSIRKLIKVINAPDSVKDNDRSLKTFFRKAQLKKFAGIFLIAITTCLLAFCVFGTIGFCVGYFTTRENVEETLKDAFRNREITALSNNIIKYDGKSLKFTYNLETDFLLIRAQESNELFDDLSFTNIMMSASIPLAFDRLVSSANGIGDKKARAIYLVAGSVGIICGYSLGENIGEEVANGRNEDALKEYFRNDSVRQMFIDKLQLLR